MTSWAARAKLHFAQKAQGGTDETDKTPISSVLSVHTERFLEKCDSANDATDTVNPTPAASLGRLRVASLALDTVIAASGMAVNPDLWCFPHSDAMNTREIDAFAARLALFNRQGVTMAQAEALALQLVERDRSMDSRRLCVECSHLIGSRCNNWQAAGVAIRSRDAFLPVELVRQFQLCPGFNVAGGVRWP